MSAGIIGGADGPTRIYISSPSAGWWIVLGVAAVILAAVLIYRHRYK